MESWIVEVVARLGYPGIVLLMIVENVFPPIPSELIMPLAGFLAAQGRMQLLLVIAAGSLGALLGTLPLYWIGRRVGEERLKRFADRHGRWLTLSRRDIERASAWFGRHGAWAVFGCRLIPGLRSLISLPAGMHRMPFAQFLAVSALGTLLWTGVLAWLGYLLGSHFAQVGTWIDPVAKVVLGAIVLLYLWRVLTHKGARAADPPP